MTSRAIGLLNCTSEPYCPHAWAELIASKWKNGTYSAISGDGLVTYWYDSNMTLKADTQEVRQQLRWRGIRCRAGRLQDVRW
jgi:hypothetical protein